jgi:hypothetical protein
MQPEITQDKRRIEIVDASILVLNGLFEKPPYVVMMPAVKRGLWSLPDIILFLIYWR